MMDKPSLQEQIDYIWRAGRQEPRQAGRPITVYVCINCGLPSGTLERRSDGTYAHGRQTPCEKVIAEERKG